jgi:putative FmdB family regulatory protein
VPTYSYRCTECDTAFDIQQAFTDNTLTECPTCGGKLRKVFSSIGVTFNGSGFYRNDSRSESKSSGLAAQPGSRDKGSDKSSSGTPSSGTSSSGTSAPAKESSSASSAPAAAKPAAKPST